jgi:hypothetical protein
MKILPVIAILAAVGVSVAAMPSSGSGPLRSTPVTGDYVEARTASVFCGPCHYNGELVTVGRDALMAWSFASGTYHGVDLSGLKAMAAISCEDNLSVESAARTSVLAIDPKASVAQEAALVALIRGECGKELGEITAVKRTSIAFVRSDEGYKVEAPGFATMTVSYRTDKSCCVQPGLVWYEPLAPVAKLKVGFTEMAAYSGDADKGWYRTGEDSAFYGGFAF